MQVVHDKAERKYKLEVDGHVAFIEYEMKDGVLVILHTRVPPELGSRGIGTQLAEAALKDLRSRGEPIQIICPFVRSIVLKRPEYADFAPGGRLRLSDPGA
jgi:predicted GNAT family acetyltransferase